MIKAVLFDFWGTLGYHAEMPELVQLRSAMTPTHQKQFTDEIEFIMKKKYTKPQAMNHIQKAIPLSREEKEKVKKFLSTIDGAIYDDVLETLKQLQKRKIKIALVSNTQSAGFKKELQELGIKKYFDAYGLSFETGYLKPDPRIFHHALKELNVKPHEAIMVGDSLATDMLGGKAGGLITGLIDRSRTKKKTKECDYVLHDLRELDEIISQHQTKGR